MKITKSMKHRAAAALAGAVRFGIKSIPSLEVRRALIDRVFSPYLGWRKFEFTATTRFGALMHLSLPDSIQSSIYLTGVWEPVVTDLINTTLVPGDIFVDVGANVGYYTLMASRLVGPVGKVFAFEASPSIFRKLMRNVESNSCTNVFLYNVAITDRAGSVVIWSAPDGNIGHSTIIEGVALADGHLREAEIRCDTLAATLPVDILLKSRLIKMDIEGAERLALEGITAWLPEFSMQTEWIVELSPGFCPGGHADTDWIFATFERAGYKAYLIENSYAHILPDDSVSAPEGVTPLATPPVGRLNDVLFSRDPRRVQIASSRSDVARN